MAELDRKKKDLLDPSLQAYGDTGRQHVATEQARQVQRTEDANKIGFFEPLLGKQESPKQGLQPVINKTIDGAPEALAGNTLADPNVEQVTQAGINGAIVPPAADKRDYSGRHPAEVRGITNDFVRQGNENIVARRAGNNQMEVGQTGFSDQNYDPSQVSMNTPMQLANPQGGAPDINELSRLATMKVDQNLPIDQLMTQIGQRNAAQKALSTMVGADTADKNRASDYEASTNKALIKQQEDARKAADSKLKESSYFSDNKILDMGFGYSPEDQDTQAKIVSVSKTDGKKFEKYFAKVTPKQLEQDIANGIFAGDGLYGLTVEQLAKAYNVESKLPQAK